MIKNLHAFKIIVAILFSLAGTMQVMAIPAKPGKIQRIQPDGSTLTFELKGDEHCHALYTCDGYMLADDNGALYYAKMVEGKAVSSNVLAHESNSRDSEEKMFVSNLEKIEFSKLYNTPEVQSSRAKAIKKASGDDFPAEGEMRGIVLLVDFKNLKMLEQHDQDSWSKLMNEENTEIYNATGSAADYFKSQSMGVFAPKFDVIGPIEMDKDFEYYGRNDGRGQDLHPQDMVKEACEKAHSDFGVDFSKYDYDGDGYVDFVYLFYAGYGEASGADSNTIWPHSSRISIFGYDLKLDGKVIDSYACSNELYGTFG
ncbi:MAG: hypothetical protein HUJ98_10280, partial [Bacteroidaceae bacterium]|nr:hypothetical protein [Bacteroidaceae bacterium]